MSLRVLKIGRGFEESSEGLKRRGIHVVNIFDEEA